MSGDKKLCAKCGEFKSLCEFYIIKRRSKRNGELLKSSYCKTCQNRSSREWVLRNSERKKELNRNNYMTHRERYMREYKASPVRYERARSSQLKSDYGITRETYKKMVQEQGNRCRLCGRYETAKTRSTGQVRELHVDHNHKTRQVRDLLCNDCNRGLGAFKEDIGLLEAAIAYIRRHSIMTDTKGHSFLSVTMRH